jgi:hypothetical protein
MQKRIMSRKKVDFLFGSQIIHFKAVPFFPIHSFVSRASDSKFLSAMSLACIVAHPTMMTHRSTIMELGGYRDVVAEDYDLWLRALLEGKTMLRHWWPQNFYRWSPKSVSRKAAVRERHLIHLRQLRIQLFKKSNSKFDDVAVEAMQNYRKSLAVRDLFLYLETGIFQNPVQSL